MAGLVRKRAEQRAAMRRAGELGKRTEYLAFTLAGDAYAVPIQDIREILRPPPITEVPRAPRNVVGVVSVRGKLLTVLDMRRLLRLTEAPLTHASRILLVDVGSGEQMGFLVDEVLQVHRLSDAEKEPANVLGGEQPAHVSGIGRPYENRAQSGSVLVLLDLRPMLESGS